MRLKDLEADAEIDCPREIGGALKALAVGAAGPHQQQLAYHFIIDSLSGADNMSFLGVEDIALVMAWREGRRYVGIQMRRIVAKPMTDPEPPPPPPARTMTERARRRGPGPD